VYFTGLDAEGALALGTALDSGFRAASVAGWATGAASAAGWAKPATVTGVDLVAAATHPPGSAAKAMAGNNPAASSPSSKIVESNHLLCSFIPLSLAAGVS